MTRPLAGPGDYAGATIGIKFGGVARATFEALGATTRGYTSGAAPFDGAELDLKTIVDNGYDAHAQALTSDIVLWPRPQFLANRAAFARLTPAQQEILRRAGREALAPEFARMEKEQKEALSVACPTAVPTSLRTTTASQLTALASGLRPVYAELERDAETKQLIAAIRKLPRHGVGRPERVGTLHPSWQDRRGRARGKLAEHRDA